MNRRQYIRIGIGIISVVGLICVFLFQRTTLVRTGGSEIEVFLVNKAIRYFLNDFFMLGLIYAIFQQRKYVVFAIYVQVVGVILFLTPYFILKLNFPRYNGPLLSFLHRLVVNPLLMLLLIPAFYFQEKKLHR